MVVAIAKFRDVLMQMANRNAMVLADKSALQQSPEGLDCVGVNLAIAISKLVIDRLMRHESPNPHVALILVCDENRVGYIYVVAKEFGQVAVLEL
jgi:hypothetical protein